MPIVRPVSSEAELEQILALQQRNLARSLDPAEIASQGFVTVEHSLDVLRRMHAIVPGIVAVEGDALAGYALVMPPECRAFIPILVPMLERIDALSPRAAITSWARSASTSRGAAAASSISSTPPTASTSPVATTAASPRSPPATAAR